MFRVLSRLLRLFDFIWHLSNESFLAQYIILLSNDCNVLFLFSLGVLFVVWSCLSVLFSFERFRRFILFECYVNEKSLSLTERVHVNGDFK